MPVVKFTYALKRFYPDLQTMTFDASKVSEVLEVIEKRHPGICSYLVDDQGALRQHVNIFINGKLIDDKIHLSDEVNPNSEVYIMQALSGG